MLWFSNNAHVYLPFPVHSSQHCRSFLSSARHHLHDRWKLWKSETFFALLMAYSDIVISAHRALSLPSSIGSPKFCLAPPKTSPKLLHSFSSTAPPTVSPATRGLTSNPFLPLLPSSWHNFKPRDGKLALRSVAKALISCWVWME